LLKYGYSNFSLEILEYCEPNNATNREQFYLDTLPHEYNICGTAGSSYGRPVSEGTRDKIRNQALGRKHSEVAKLNMKTV